jgi:hypothetical protein
MSGGFYMVGTTHFTAKIVPDQLITDKNYVN